MVDDVFGGLAGEGEAAGEVLTDDVLLENPFSCYYPSADIRSATDQAFTQLVGINELSQHFHLKP
jgi:hypothetical protein